MAQTAGLHPYQTNFTAGALAPGLYSRTDYNKYPNGAERIVNAVVKVTGGASRRAGTQFVAKSKASGAFQASAFQGSAFQTGAGNALKLVPFVFSATDAYVLEFGAKYVRFFRNREQVQGNGGPEHLVNRHFDGGLSGWSTAEENGGTVTWESSGGVAILTPGPAGFAMLYQQVTGLVPGDKYVVWFNLGGNEVDFQVRTGLPGPTPPDLVGLTRVSPGEYRVVFTAISTTATIVFHAATPNTVSWIDATSLADGFPLELATPYEAQDVRYIRWAQSADQLWIDCVGPNKGYPPMILTRLSDLVWTIQEEIQNPPPTEEIDLTFDADLTPGATTGQGVAFIASSSVFLAADVNRQIKSQGGVAIINVVNSGTQVTADIVAPFLSTNKIPPQRWSMDGSPSAKLTVDEDQPANAIVSATLDIAGFRATDVGGFIKAFDAIYEITVVSSGTAATVKIVRTGTADPQPSATPATPPYNAEAGSWSLERDSWSEGNGFPGVVNFYEQRLWHFKGQTAFGSRVGDFSDHGAGPEDDDAAKHLFTGTTNQVDLIRWVKSLEDMMVGTIGGEIRVFGGSEEAITPTRIQIKPQSEWGSDPEPDACRAGDAVIFIQRGRRQLREIGFTLEKGTAGGYQATDLAILSEHLFRSGMREVVRCSSPDSYLLTPMRDGRMNVAAYERPENVVAWGEFRPAGWPQQAKIAAACVIPAACGTGDEIWQAVQRDIGVTIEVYDGQLNTECGLVYDDPTVPADTLVGLKHLNGKTVDVVSTKASAFQKSAFQMNAFQKVRTKAETAVVTDGAVSIAVPSVRIEVGLHYDTEIETLRLEMQTPNGTAHFRKARSSTVYVRFYCTSGDGVIVDNEAVPRGELEAEEVFDFLRQARLGWDRKQKVIVKQTKPFPMTVLGISRIAQIDDGDAP